MNPDSTTFLSNLNEQQRKTLIDSIRCGECILVLGPYANLGDDGRPQEIRLANFLADNLPTQPPIDPSEKDSFGSVICQILLDPSYNRGDIIKAIATFYQQQRNRILPNSPYDLILKLEFRTIFSTDPDSWLMKAFGIRNRKLLGMYFTQIPQPDIVPFITPADGLTDETTVIMNLFGLRDRPDSLAVGPDDELRQLYALSSGEIANKINLRIAPRLTACRWYLFVGFNFNSWALGSIFYFFSRLTEKVKEARVFGLHSKPGNALTGSTVSYYKNLFPNERNKDDVQIVHADTQTFFTELSKLADEFPPPKPRDSQLALVVYHPNDRARLDSIRPQLEAKFQEFDLTVGYSQPVTAFDSPLTDEQIEQQVLTDDVVLYLISTNWDDIQYDAFQTLAQQRNSNIGVKAVLLDTYNLYEPGQLRQFKPAFNDGSINLLNGQRPLNLPADLDSFLKELDAFLEDTLVPV